LLETAVTVNVWTSLAAPEVMPDKLTVCSPPFYVDGQSLMTFSVGGWFPLLIVTVNVRVTMLLGLRLAGIDM